MPKLSEEDITAKLSVLDDWENRGNAIQKVFKRKNFVESMIFVNQVADLSEEA